MVLRMMINVWVQGLGLRRWIDEVGIINPLSLRDFESRCQLLLPFRSTILEPKKSRNSITNSQKNPREITKSLIELPLNLNIWTTPSSY
jgi:hypothetical protein